MSTLQTDARIPNAADAGAASFDATSAPVTLYLRQLSGPDWANTVFRLRQICGRSIHTIVGLAPHIDVTAASSALASENIDVAEFTLLPAPSLCPDVIPRCPLLTPEFGCLPWSSRGLMCPPETAWIPLQLSLADFDDDFVALGNRLDALVDCAERLHDSARWPTPAMQRDAWLNRRIALELIDIGQFAVGRSLSVLHRCIGWISARLQARSEFWAERRRPHPAILAADPSDKLRPSPTREQWRARWLAAVTASAVRHRNLLALSPWEMSCPQSAKRLELLSLLIHADVVCLAPPQDRPAMTSAEHATVLRAVRVALQQRHALDQIAKHV